MTLVMIMPPPETTRHLYYSVVVQRSRILLLEPQRDATPPPMAPAPHLMFNIGGLLKLKQIVTVFYFSIIFLTISIKIERKSSPNP
jgi:hypothetical protein